MMREYRVQMLRPWGRYSRGQIIPAAPGNFAKELERRGHGRIIAIDGEPVGDRANMPVADVIELPAKRKRGRPRKIMV